MNHVIGFINLYDSPDLGPISQNRAPATTSFLGRYALIDFALSNFTNSGLDQFSILVRDNFRSVNKHVNSLKTWVTNTKIGVQNVLICEKGIKDRQQNTDLNCIKENEWVLDESHVDYAIIQPGHIITAIDFNPVLEVHKKSGADVTMMYAKINDAQQTFRGGSIPIFKEGTNEVIDLQKNNGTIRKSDISIQTYIINISLLRKMLVMRGDQKADSLLETLENLLEKKKIKVNGYLYEGFIRSFESFNHYVKYSFEVLDLPIAQQIFDTGNNVYTINHNSLPVMYGENANIRNTYIANGSVVEGTVENSIISRHVHIGKGAVIKNCIIFTGTKIGECAIIENALIDKNVIIGDNAKVKGHKSSLEYIRKGKIVK